MSCFVKNVFSNFYFIFYKPTNYFISQPLHVIFYNIKSDNIVEVEVEKKKFKWDEEDFCNYLTQIRNDLVAAFLNEVLKRENSLLKWY